MTSDEAARHIRIELKLDDVLTRLRASEARETDIMSVEQDLQTEMDEIKTDFGLLVTAYTTQAASIVQLQQQLAAGGPVTQAQLDALVAEGQGVIATLPAALVPPGTAPAPGISPTSGSVGTLVTVTGSGFGATQGSSTVSFGGVAGTPASWADGSIVVPVPVGAVTGPVVVTVGGVPSNAAVFTVTP